MDTDKANTFVIDCGCCQKTLQALVHAIYQRSIRVTADSIEEILDTADFLQVSMSILLILIHPFTESSATSYTEVGHDFERLISVKTGFILMTRLSVPSEEVVLSTISCRLLG